MLLLLALHAASTFDFDAPSSQGLQVSVAGAPVVRGSWFQYYEPGWTKGYYSSNWNPQKVERPDSDTVQVSFASEDGLAHGSQTYRRDGERLKAHYHFDWEGDHPVEIESAEGLVWAPAVQAGTLAVDGQATRPLSPTAYRTQSPAERQFGPEGKRFAFQGPLGRIEATSTQPLVIFDGRNGYRQDWAEGKQLLWLGAPGLIVAKGKPVDFDVEWHFSPSQSAAAARPPQVATLTPRHVPDALAPSSQLPPLVPRPADPRRNQLNFAKPLDLTGLYSFPAGRFLYFEDFLSGLRRRFLAPAPEKGGTPVLVDGGISKMGMRPGGYSITITPTSISVLGEEDEGLRNALQRLTQLAFVHNGHVALPTGSLVDQPDMTWRGVHLFVGKEAPAFQHRLWGDVLRPMLFNKVVLQCERTAWDSLPGIATAQTMSKADLKHLFAMYRSWGVEPIPLIESFGHMEWLFANGQNLDVAFNPQVPYAVDPRKPRTKELLAKLWDEVIETVQPKTVHFGCDEVDMRGFPGDPKLTTDLWGTQMATLGEIAKSHGVGEMIWGDACLAPGEAPDATSAPNAEEAAKRRAAIPKGTVVTDWHYKADADPAAFRPVLQLWEKEGIAPIAATWYRPENIRGFDLAADAEKQGTLQTTWAGYVSDEAGMLAHVEQFTAMIVAADYSWSGRQDPVSRLGYDPVDVFRRLYFGEPEPVRPVAGAVFESGAGIAGELHVGGVTVHRIAPIVLGSRVADGGPDELDLRLSGSGREIALALDTQVHGDEGEPVATADVELANGRHVQRTLLYGLDVRSADDPAACARADRGSGLSVVRIDLGETPVAIKAVRLISKSATLGLRLHGVTMW